MNASWSPLVARRDLRRLSLLPTAMSSDTPSQQGEESRQVDDIKREAYALFLNADHEGAASKYAEAIELVANDATLYTQRARSLIATDQ